MNTDVIIQLSGLSALIGVIFVSINYKKVIKWWEDDKPDRPD